MDLAISEWIFSTFHTNKAFAVFWAVISFLGNLWAFVVITALLLCFKKTRKIGMFLAVSCGLVWVLNSLILKPLIARPRPFMANPDLAGLCELAGMSLPPEFSMASGHAANSMAIAMTVFMFSKKWGGVVFIYPFMMGLSRICLCVHYASDVLVGWVIGAAVAIACHYLLNLLIKYFVSKKEKKNGKVSSSISE